MFRAYGLYTQIQANRLRSIVLLAAFVLLLQALVFSFALLTEATGPGTTATMMARAFGDLAHLWPISLGAAAIWFVIAYIFHQKFIDFATGSASIDRAAAPKLYAALENLCISRGIPMPALKIIESDGLNAFAAGLRQDNRSVSVTRGLLDRLNTDELEAVLAHELTHIRNRDVELLVVAVIFAGIFAFVGDLVFRSWNFPFGLSPRSNRGSSSDDSKGSGKGAILAIVIALAIILISWGLSVVIRLAISRAREYLADAGAVELTKNPDALISALRKIEAHSAIPEMPSRMTAFFIENPSPDPDRGWLSTHPSMQKRIDALVRYAGGTDPGLFAPASAIPIGGAPTMGATSPPPTPLPPISAQGPWGRRT